MRIHSSVASRPMDPQHIRRPSFWLRALLLITVALGLATVIATRSPDASYEDQLLSLALHKSHGSSSSAIASSSGEVKALLLDYDDELAFKAQLAVEKYGDDARQVLVHFGDDPTFQEVMRQYGENAVPVISYFVNNDVTSMRLLYLAQQKSDSAITAAQESWSRFWHNGDTPEPKQEKAPDVYGPELRGRRAIAMILEDGHPFLGQFVVDAQGNAAWVQTERAAQAMKSLFLSGAINLEKKYRSGKPLEAVDFLSAGVDAFVVVGAFKALKFLRATQQLRAVGVMKRTQLLGAPLLRTSFLGRTAMKYGVAAGAVYLVARHPSLLSSAFVAIGTKLGLSPLLSKTMGWTVVLTTLLLPMLALFLLVLRVAAALFTGASRGSQWALRRLGWRAPRTV